MNEAIQEALTNMPTVNPSRLPVGYTEVAFIKTVHSGFGINTGVKPNLSTTRIKLEISNLTFMSTSTADEYIISTNGTQISGAYRYLSIWLNSNTLIGWRDAGSNFSQKTADIVNKKITIDYNLPKKQFVVGENAFALTSGNYSISNPMYIGVCDSSLKSATFGLYSCQIYNDDEIIRDFVPCYDPSWSVGLFDLVEWKFYKNSFSGTIVTGPAV